MDARLTRVAIENIWTRIYYENKVLKYEISIELLDGRQIKYKVFEDYSKYRSTLDSLIKVKANKESIELHLGIPAR